MSDSLVGAPRLNRRFGLQNFAIVEKILRDRQKFFTEIREGVELPAKMKTEKPWASRGGRPAAMASAPKISPKGTTPSSSGS